MDNRSRFKDEIRNTMDLKIKLVKSGVWNADTLSTNVANMKNVKECKPNNYLGKVFLKFDKDFVNNLATGWNPSLYSMVNDSIKNTINDNKDNIVSKGLLTKEDLENIDKIGYASLYNITVSKSTNSAIIEL